MSRDSISRRSANLKEERIGKRGETEGQPLPENLALSRRAGRCTWQTLRAGAALNQPSDLAPRKSSLLLFLRGTTSFRNLGSRKHGAASRQRSG